MLEQGTWLQSECRHAGAVGWTELLRLVLTTQRYRRGGSRWKDMWSSAGRRAARHSDGTPVELI